MHKGRLLMRLHANFASVDGADGEREQLELCLRGGWFGQALHAQARVHFLVALFVNHMSKAIENVVHPHE